MDVGISFGKLATLSDGLGEFSVQLGRRLAARAPALARDHGIRLHFHLPARRFGLFGDGVAYLQAHAGQKLLHWRATRFDLWHSLNQLNKFVPPVGAARRVVTAHDLNFFYVKEGFSLHRELRRSRAMLQRTDHLVTISEYVRRDYLARLGWTGPSRVIYNGARSLVGAPQEAPPGLDERPFFFHLSRMAASKNAQALVQLARAWPERRFVLGGPRCGASEAIEASARALGAGNVTVVYDLTDAQKAWLYQHCEAFLFPSLAEGFGLPPIEAMHFGKPVFLADRTCLPEIGGDAAFYWSDFEPAAMRQVMEQGLARHAAEGMGARARLRARTFDWDRCADQYVALYLELLGLEAAPASVPPQRSGGTAS